MDRYEPFLTTSSNREYTSDERPNEVEESADYTKNCPKSTGISLGSFHPSKSRSTSFDFHSKRVTQRLYQCDRVGKE